MSEHTQTSNGTEQAPQAPKRRRSQTRSPNVARPAFVVIQVLDENDQPMANMKPRVKIIATERSAEKVMETLDSGDHTNAFYLRVIVPAGTRAGSTNRPKAD